MISDFGFVVPVEAEAQPLIQNLSKKRCIENSSRVAYSGVLHHKKISLIVSGCGKIKSASATQYLIDTHPAKIYIHYGTAGAISDKLKIGDIVIATQVIEHDVVELFPQSVPPPTHTLLIKELMKQLNGFHESPIVWGPVLSGDEDIITTKRKNELQQKYSGASVDWESAGFALTCQLNNVQGYVFRGISDYAYEHTALEYEKYQKIVIGNMMKLLYFLVKA